jgi:hypothetical protein
MSKTAVPATTGSPSLLPVGETPQPKPKCQHGIAYKALTALASLRLTVWLFVLAIALVFFGTLAQVDEGIWTVLSKYFRTGLARVPFQVFVRFGQIFFNLSQDISVPGAFPFPGGWLIGGCLLANLLAAHATRFKLTWKRSGILVLHAGLVVMMVSELITGLLAVESRMFIKTGQSANFLQHHLRLEMAMVDSSNPDHDDVVMIPGSILRKGGTIQNDLLPFDVEVLKYMVNSDLYEKAPEGVTNPATDGSGLTVVAVEQPEVSGAAAEQRDDIASMFVTFKEKGTGKALGTYLVSQWFTWNPLVPPHPEHVSCKGKTYDVSLRRERMYQPFTIHLLEFHHDKYLGTETPRNYSSRIRLVDPSQDEDREFVISMNEPLRYAGDTFYQSGVLPGDQGTILQVVNNPGWLMPYISCVLVSVGMILHFGLHLIGFLGRRGVL